jgi:hypothetical protein
VTKTDRVFTVGEAGRCRFHLSKGFVMDDFQPPSDTAGRSLEHLFVTRGRRRVSSPAESHEYKKISGSSDAAHTYDTTAI